MPRSPERILQELESEGFDTSGVGGRTREKRLEREAREKETDRIESSVEVEFGSRAGANEVRDKPTVAKYLADTDDRRTRTIQLDDDAPEEVVDTVTIEAADETKEEAQKHGQIPLTAAEKAQLDFSQVNTLRARSIKGIAVGEGVDDWTAFVDPTLTVDEHREVLRNAAREDSGGAFEGGDLSNERVDAFLGNAFETVSREERERAVESEFGGDVDAADFLRSSRESGETVAGMFDVDVSGTSVPGVVAVSGAEGDRLVEIHEARSSRAKAIDERRRSSRVTRDPLEWAANPGRVDYPGIDTIRPDRVHERRSERAQTIDEREIAPRAESLEAWVANPDRSDWPGVDRPGTYGPTADAEIPIEERGARGREGLLESLADSLFDENLRFGPPRGRDIDEFDAPPGAVETVDVLGSDIPAFGEGEEPPLELEDPGAADDVGELADEFLGGGEQEDILDMSNMGSQMGLGGEEVETESQATFGFVESDEGESRLDVERASEFGVDDRGTARRGAEREREETLEAGLEAFGGGERRNVRLDEL